MEKIWKMGWGKNAFRKQKVVSSLVCLQLYFVFFFWLKFQGSNGAGVAAKKNTNKKVMTERRPGWSPKTNSIMPSKPSSGGRLISISAFSMVRAWGWRVLTQDLFLGYVAKCAQTNGSKGTEAD